MVATRKVFAENQPYFGVETKEIHLLRTVAKAVQEWRDEVDGVSLEDILEALKSLETFQRKHKKVN